MKNSVFVIGASILLLQGCAAPQPERVILLPQEDGSPSAVVVQSKSGSLLLEQPYAVAKVGDRRIEAESTDAAGVAQRYRAIMDALPARPRSYTLNFEFGKTQLTKESRALLDTILRELQQLPAAELVIIGHADDVGSDAINDQLSLERANSVLKLIRSTGITPYEISVVGRGKRELLVVGKRGVPEPRNRRVEIRVK